MAEILASPVTPTVIRRTNLILIILLIFNSASAQISFDEGSGENGTGLASRAAQTPSSSPTASVAIKFVTFLAFEETGQQAQLIVEVFSEKWTEENALKGMFLNAREVKILGGFGGKVQVKVTIPCDMHYILYPYDSHACSIILASPDPGTELTPLFCGDLKTYEFHVKGYLGVPLPGKKTSGQVVYLVVERLSSQQLFSQMYSPVMTLAWLSFLTMLTSLKHSIRIGSSLAMLLTGLVVTSILWREIPHAGEVTVVEHYFAVAVGFIFQVFFTNILMYWYSALAQKHGSESKVDKATENGDLEAPPENGKVTSKKDARKEAKEKLSEEEEFVMKLGKCHRLMYFKMLKPGKKQLPIAFLIINVVYWVLVLYLSSGLPKGFQHLPESSDASKTNALCL